MVRKRDSKSFNLKFLLITCLLAIALLMSGCVTSPISEVTTADYVGKKVTVSGVVENTVKLGDFSGYSLTDESGTIRISSEALPAEGSTKTVTGILIKDTLFGYYIKLS